MGFLVGVVICYQILYTDVMDHLKEYATLKAMGYSNRYIVGVVLSEAVLLSLIALVPSLKEVPWPPGQGQGSSKLTHERHYTARRGWVRWCLCGPDPTLPVETTLRGQARSGRNLEVFMTALEERRATEQALADRRRPSLSGAGGADVVAIVHGRAQRLHDHRDH